MPFLDEYVIPVRRSSKEQFVAQEAPFFLVCRHEPEVEEREWSFRTDSISKSRVAIASFMAQQGLTVTSDVMRYEVFPVVKTQRNPWKDHVSIGRARNNDIVLPDSSVSKLHAHINLDKGGAISIGDAGSRNGTKVNEAKLEGGKAAPLQSGDTLTLGRVEVLLFDASALYDFVTERIQQIAR